MNLLRLAHIHMCMGAPIHTHTHRLVEVENNFDLSMNLMIVCVCVCVQASDLSFTIWSINSILKAKTGSSNLMLFDIVFSISLSVNKLDLTVCVCIERKFYLDNVQKVCACVCVSKLITKNQFKLF